jgi:hypothetical protein
MKKCGTVLVSHYCVTSYILSQGWPTTQAAGAIFEFTLWPRATEHISGTVLSIL